MLWQIRKGLISGRAALDASAAPPFTPASLTGLVGWYKADTGVTVNGSNEVTAVANQATAGLSNNLVNNGIVPYNATGLNSLPAFDFLAANTSALSTSSFPMGTGTMGSVFIVGQMKSSTASFGGAVVYGANTGTGNDYNEPGSAAWLTRDATDNTVETFASSSVLSTQAISLATTYRIGSIFDGANVKIYLNNVVSGVTNAYSTAWNNNGTLVIGNRFISGSVGGGAWDGPIAEIIITTSALTLTEQNNLDAYFTGRGY